MAHGKRAGERCVQLTADYACAIFGHPDRPAVCAQLGPSPDMCRDNREQALVGLETLERATRPAPEDL